MDAHETAKANEPTWTVQGGDPLGGALLRIWSLFARVQAQVIPDMGVQFVFEQILKAANTRPPKSKKERETLLIQADVTEHISWIFDRYLKGTESSTIEQTREIGDELARLDIYDARRRTVSLISNFFSELNDYREKLLELGFLDEELNNAIEGSILGLRTISSKIEVRRGT